MSKSFFQFWCAQTLFFLTGGLILVAQQLTYDGANKPINFLVALSQYVSMGIFGLLYLLIKQLRERDTSAMKIMRKLLTAPKINAAATVAIPDLGDCFFAAVGFNYAGSSVFIVVYSFLTVWTALMRKFCLKRSLRNLQWFSIFFIAGGASRRCL
jgi:hypothetical protein